MRFLTIAEFCELKRCSRSKVYEELKSGRLIGHKVGRGTRIRSDDADKWGDNLPRYPAKPRRDQNPDEQSSSPK